MGHLEWSTHWHEVKNQTIVHTGPDLRSASASANPHLVLKKLLSGFTKDTVANCTEKAWTVIFATPYWICICTSLPFDLSIYGRRAFKWIMQCDLLRFTLVNSLVFVALFNVQKACFKAGGNLRCPSLKKVHFHNEFKVHYFRALLLYLIYKKWLFITS